MATVPPNLDAIPTLQRHTTLHSPTPNVRTWSSAPHPSPHTPLLATATSDRAVYIWDTRDWKLLSTIAGGHKRSVRCVGWKDYGERRTKRRKKAEETEQEEQEQRPARQPVLLATGSFDSNCGLWIWNRDGYYGNTDDSGMGEAVSNNTTSSTIPGAFGDPMNDDDDDVEQDFTHTAAAGANNENEEEEEWQFSTLLTGPDSEIKDVTFAPPHYGANLLATCSRDKSVWVWEEVEPEEWETVAVLGEHTGDVKCLAWLNGAVGVTKTELRKRLRVRRERERERMDVDNRDGRDDADEEEDEIVLGGRELLASGSYDDTIRLHHDDEAEGDWLTIAVLTGHEGTVWDLKFEPYVNLAPYPLDTTVDEVIADWAPRLISCSDDLTIRVWRKQLNEKERVEKRSRISDARRGNAVNSGESDADTSDNGRIMQTGFAGTLIPSVIRPPTSTERWIEEAQFPAVHVRSVYAVDWSAQTGLVVSCGGDGIIAVYQEVASAAATLATSEAAGDDVVMNGTVEHPDQNQDEDSEGEIQKRKTEWRVVALMEAAHDEYEINHVCWAPRRDLKRRQYGLEDNGVVESDEKDEEDQEYIISTGDDGQVRVWRLPKEVLAAVRQEL